MVGTVVVGSGGNSDSVLAALLCIAAGPYVLGSPNHNPSSTGSTATGPLYVTSLDPSEIRC